MRPVSAPYQAQCRYKELFCPLVISKYYRKRSKRAIDPLPRIETASWSLVNLPKYLKFIYLNKPDIVSKQIFLAFVTSTPSPLPCATLRHCNKSVFNKDPFKTNFGLNCP